MFFINQGEGGLEHLMNKIENPIIRFEPIASNNTSRAARCLVDV